MFQLQPGSEIEQAFGGDGDDNIFGNAPDATSCAAIAAAIFSPARASPISC